MTSNRIEDVAKRAGVSMKTVSRVLNHEPNVRPAMRDKVMAAVAELNYRPNLSARSLAGNRSYLVALLYGNVSPSYLVNVQTGVLEVCNTEHYGLVLHPCTNTGAALVREIGDLLSQTRLDGLILTPPVSNFTPLIEMLRERGIPYIRISPTDLEDGAAVAIDEGRAAYDVTRYLIGLGHRRIGFIKGPADHGASHWRYAAFARALAESGIEQDSNLIVQGDFSFESGVQAGAALLSLARPPTAVFASNDDMAAGVLHVAHDRGVKVPAELSVTGFDDTPLARQVWPRLTTVHQPIQGLGQAAARRLLQMIRGAGEEAATRGPEILAYELKIRDSSGPARDDV